MKAQCIEQQDISLMRQTIIIISHMKINSIKDFTKDTRELKIVIPYLRENFNDDKEIVRAICDNFSCQLSKQIKG